MVRTLVSLGLSLTFVAASIAHPPVASYVFPAGGQRGTTVNLRVGGLFLHQSCRVEVLGPGVRVSPTLKRIPTLWFEGPILPLPDSQRQEDYPQDMAGTVTLAPEASPGVRYLRMWTSQGATSSLRFQVGDLPEILENEIDGDPIPVHVETPLTINGRIFPREDVDLWSFQARRGQSFTCEVNAGRLGSPLDARLEILNSAGTVLLENEDARDADPRLRFTAPADGLYQVRIRDSQFQGGQAFVYRLTITSEPVVDHVFPLGGRRGSTVSLQPSGQGVPSAPVNVAIPAEAPGDWHAPLPFGKSRPTVLLDIDDLPEVVEGMAGAQSAPVILNGRIDVPGDIDSWTLKATKAQPVQIHLRAAAFGSPLDGVVTIWDEAGKMLTRVEGEKPAVFTPPADGTYTLKVQDRFRSRGGPAFAYRLRVTPPSPEDFRLTLAVDGVSVLRKGQAKLKLAVERFGGFKEPIKIEAEGLPEGVKLAPLTIKAGQANADLVFQGDEKAPIDVRGVAIVGHASGKDGSWQRRATVPAPRGSHAVDSLLVAVALPTPFVIKGEYDMGFAPRGTTHRRKYKIERNGFEGPIEISLADRQARHLQGVTGPTILVPPGQNEFTYEAYLPPWMETGRTCRVCVMGVGVVQDGGKEHRVAFSSVNQNEQLVAVVGPGQLALELGRSSATATPGGRIEVPVRVKRGLNVRGEVKVDITVARHQTGVRAEPLVLAAEQEEGVLIVRFSDRLEGPFTMPFVVRATLTLEGRPIVAEASIDVQP